MKQMNSERKNIIRHFVNLSKRYFTSLVTDTQKTTRHNQTALAPVSHRYSTCSILLSQPRPIVYDPKIQGTRARHYIRVYSLSSLISIDSTDTCTFHGSSNNRDWRKKSRCREHKSRTQSGLVTIVSLLKP